MSFLHHALKILAPKDRAFKESTKNPRKAQKKLLFEFLGRNCRTEYGRAHSFSEIKTIIDYQNFVPVRKYTDLQSSIERMTNGEKNILTRDKVILFAVTSGSTGRAKFIPVTRYSRSKKAAVMSLWSYHIASDYPKIFDGKALAIVSPEVEGYTKSSIPYGTESGHGYKNIPAVIKNIYALPYEVFEIRDYNSRYYSILRLGMEKNITTIATLNPSTIVLLCQKIEDFQDKIIKDIEEGSLSKELDIPETIRKSITRQFKPNPKRATQLKEILEKTKTLLPKYIWPNLQLIECWKAGTVGLYLKEFPKYFGNTPVRDFGYLSTEARSSIPISDIGAGGILAVNSNFYEFIPKNQIDAAKKDLLLCDQLETGKEYFVVLTTPGGLYRYDIDDVIRVNGFYNKTPIIEFVQKGLNVTSVTGEKLYESQIVEAVNKAADRYKMFIEFFTTSIQWGTPPRYVFLVEFNQNTSLNEKKDLLGSIEKELCSINIEYDTKRKSQRLEHPILKVVKRGSFKEFREKKVKSGMHDGQFKVPQLTPELDFHKNFNIEEEIFIDR